MSTRGARAPPPPRLHPPRQRQADLDNTRSSRAPQTAPRPRGPNRARAASRAPPLRRRPTAAPHATKQEMERLPSHALSSSPWTNPRHGREGVQESRPRWDGVQDIARTSFKTSLGVVQDLSGRRSRLQDPQHGQLQDLSGRLFKTTQDFKTSKLKIVLKTSTLQSRQYLNTSRHGPEDAGRSGMLLWAIQDLAVTACKTLLGSRSSSLGRRSRPQWDTAQDFKTKDPQDVKTSPGPEDAEKTTVRLKTSSLLQDLKDLKTLRRPQWDTAQDSRLQDFKTPRRADGGKTQDVKTCGRRLASPSPSPSMSESTSLITLPTELLLNLPFYLYSIEDLCSLFSTCRTLHHACANPDPKVVPRLAANSGRVFFRPHPHLLIAATARQVADWAVRHKDHRYLLEVAIQGGVEKLLELAIDVTELSMDDIRRIYTYKCDVLNPLNRRLDVAAGPASGGHTVCNDPETTLLSWVIYGELFHHSLELAYLPLPEYKPLSSIIRYKWFVYCMPDVNSFNYMNFENHPEFFKAYVQDDNDRFQQLSMTEAMDGLLHPSSWKCELQESSSFQTITELPLSCVMHMGMKSLEVLLPGRHEGLEEDLGRIVNGIGALVDDSALASKDKHLLEFVGDAWLSTAYVSLASDMAFTLWGLGDEADRDLLMAAIRSAPQKNTVEPTT
ncbi:hypothetical protein C8R44DRAFT_870029 [Mycena epipterygia]|nr:hypothetical protein C8R44DRAFT_870029 [Mycena epipterygia]